MSECALPCRYANCSYSAVNKIAQYCFQTSGKTNNNRLVNGIADDLVDVAELKEEARKKRREEERRELTSYLSDGSDSMLKMAAKNAMVSYQKALDMLSHHDGNQDELGLDETDLVTLKYACGMSAISTGLHKVRQLNTFPNHTL